MQSQLFICAETAGNLQSVYRERCEVAGMQKTQVCENFATKLSIPIVFHSRTAPRDSHGKMGFPNSHLYCRPLEPEHVKAVQGEKFREKASFKVVWMTEWWNEKSDRWPVFTCLSSWIFYQYTALSSRTEDAHQVYSGGSIVGKASLSDPDISPNPPLG